MKAALLALGIAATLFAGCRHEPDAAPVTPTDTLYSAPTPWTLPGAPNWAIKSLDTSEAEMTVEGVALGKALFFDTGLSADGRVSCASCHRPERAFTDGQPVSRGVFGRMGTRSSMAIVNIANVQHLFWDGREAHLTAQVGQPILHMDEMGMTPEDVELRLQQGDYPTLFAKAFRGGRPNFDSARIALSMFCRSLVSFNSRYDRALRGEIELTQEEKRGMLLFNTHPVPETGTRGANCIDCHKSLTLAGENDPRQMLGFANNGIGFTTADLGQGAAMGKPALNGRFRIPTLRNIELTAPYMHDGRFTTLEQVMDHYNDPDLFTRPGVDALISLGSNYRSYSSLGLTEQEKSDVIAFLKTLTDTTYLHP